MMIKSCILLLSLVQSMCLLKAQDLAKTVHARGKGIRAEVYPSVTINGGWCWFSDPRAVYFEGKHKRTYIGWGTSSGDIVVAFYDHERREINSRVLIEKLEADDHDNPAILIGKDGKLKVFFSKHAKNYPIQLYQSKNPEDISAWEIPISL